MIIVIYCSLCKFLNAHEHNVFWVHTFIDKWAEPRLIAALLELDFIVSVQYQRFLLIYELLDFTSSSALSKLSLNDNISGE